MQYGSVTLCLRLRITYHNYADLQLIMKMAYISYARVFTLLKNGYSVNTFRGLQGYVYR